MSDGSPSPGDKPRPAPFPHGPAAKNGRRRGSFLLAAWLSIILIAMFAAYLAVAPNPVTHPPPDTAVPAVRATAIPALALTLIAPRSVMTKDILADFETGSGLAINLVLYDNEESLLEIAIDKPLVADVVLVAGPTVQELNRRGQLSFLSAREIANLSQIDPAMRTWADRYDRGGLHAVPFAWTTYGLGVNRAAASSVLGHEVMDAAPALSWGVLFDPVQAAKVAQCGIVSVDMPSVAFPLAQRFLGLSIAADTPTDVERASALWESARPFIKAFDTVNVADALARGDACLGLASAAEIYRARVSAREAGRDFAIDFQIPREGGLVRVYMLAVLRSSPRPDRSMALIDYLLKPEVSARMTNARWAANAIPSSRLYLRQEIKGDPYIYPDIARYEFLFPEEMPPPATASLRSRFWRLMNAGAPPRVTP